MHWVYVVCSDEGGRFYIGVSVDVRLREQQHNAGVSKWTRRYAGTWRLVWSKSFPTLGEARQFENLLKRQKGGGGFFRLTGIDPARFDRSGS